MGRTEEAVDFATEELAGRPAAHRPGGRRGRRPGASPRCCSARPREAAERGVELTVTGEAPTSPSPAGRAARPGHRSLGNLVDNAMDAVGRTPPSGGSRSGSTARDGRLHHRASATAAPACPPRTAPRGPRARLVHQGRRRAAAGSASPWSPRWRGATAARSTSARSPYGGAEFTVRARHRRAGEHRHDRAGAGRRGRGDRRRGPRGVRRPGRGLRGRRRRALGGGGRAPPATATGTSTWCCSTCTCPTATASACSSSCAAAGHLLRRDRGDLGPRRRRGPARGGPGRRALPAQAVHLRRRSAPSSSSTPTTAPGSPRPPSDVVQDEVDQLLRRAAPAGAGDLPKGMSAETLQQVTAALRAAARRPVGDRGGRRRSGPPGSPRGATSSTSPTPGSSSGRRGTAAAAGPRWSTAGPA